MDYSAATITDMGIACLAILIFSPNRPLSRRLAPPAPAGIVWHRSQPKNRQHAAKLAEIMGCRHRRNFDGVLGLAVIIGLLVKLIMIATVTTFCLSNP